MSKQITFKIKPNIQEFKVKFGVKPNEINIHTLLKSLSNITTILDEVNKEISPDNRINVKVKALEKGSFLVHLGISEAEINSLLAGGLTIQAIGKMIKVFIGLLKLRKELKDNKPEQVTEKGDNIIIKTGIGNKITVIKQTFNMYNDNAKVNEALSETFQTLEDDITVKSFEIEDKKEKPIFEVNRDEFKKMAVRNEIEKPKEGIKIEKQFTTLFVLKAVFEKKNRKWEFYYRGNKISAIIKDQNFLNLVDKGERFGKGSTLEVEMDIIKKFDKTVNTFVIVGYEIIKVKKHHPKEDNQEKLEL